MPRPFRRTWCSADRSRCGSRCCRSPAGAMFVFVCCFARIVEQAARDLPSSSSSCCGYEVRRARTLVVVPGFLAELEVHDVLLDAGSRSEAGGRCSRRARRKPVIAPRSSFSLASAVALVAGAIRSLGPDQRVLVVRHVLRLEVRRDSHCRSICTAVSAADVELEVVGAARIAARFRAACRNTRSERGSPECHAAQVELRSRSSARSRSA